MRIAVLTANGYRHMACVQIIERILGSRNYTVDAYIELPSDFDNTTQGYTDKIIAQHLRHRDMTEFDFFGDILHLASERGMVEQARVPRGYYSSEAFLTDCRDRQYALIAVFGTSIIRGPIIRDLGIPIINLHLGLSPYYRGAGTNFFPIVNGEPQFYGATYLLLDEGIDTGPIIHQIRPIEFSELDSFHQFSCRFLRNAFTVLGHVCIKVLDGEINMKYTQDDYIFSEPTRKVFRKSDLTGESVMRLYANIDNGILKLLKDQVLLSSVPIVTQL